MNFGFQEYSLLWLFFCLVLASAYTFILYRSEKNFPHKIKITLAALRFIGVLIISFFLFSPLITRKSLSYEKPIILVAQDNSSSIISSPKKTYYQNDYLKNRKDFIDKLSSKFEVVDISVGAELSMQSTIDYHEKKTNLSLVLQEANQTYKNRNLAAIVLASDGIHNSGTEPSSYINTVNAPVYTILQGDSIAQRDLKIYNLVHNEIVYLKNDFQIEIKLNAYDLKAKRSNLRIEHNGKTVWAKEINISTNNEQLSFQAILPAEQAGLQKYTIKATPISGEKNLKNNVREFYIDVIENKQNIAIVAAAPHPDLAAIKSSLESNENYKVDVFMNNDVNLSDINKYQLLILHQLPSSISDAGPLFKLIDQKSIPAWLILGAQSYIDIYNRLPFGLKILNSKASANEVFLQRSNEFQGFVLDNNWDELMKELPPIYAPYGNYKVSNGMQTLFYQRIGMVQTEQPLLSFGKENNRKYSILCGEGIWKWRMQNYKLYGNTELFDDFSSKIVQYLSSKDDKRKFRLNLASYKVDEGEPVLFSAELYNDSYNLINTPEVKLELLNEKKKRFDYVFSKTSNAYELTLSNLPNGEYTYYAICTLGNNKYEAKGKFTVIQNNLEDLNTEADFENLRLLSKLSGGKAFGDNEFNKLYEELSSNNTYKTISFEEKKTDEMINLKWIFIVLISIFTLEWVLRKYHGMY